MKTIAKIAALAMTLSLAFVLTACGGSASSSAAASSASASASSASAAASSTSASASAVSASASSAAASVDADTYTNDAFSIRFNLPKGWSFIDKATLKEVNTAMSSLMGSAEVDMVAANAEATQMVIVGIEYPTTANKGMTAQQHLDADIEEMGKALQGTYSYTSTSATVTFDGIDRELPAAIIDLSAEGKHVYMCEAVAEKDGYFFDALTMAGSQEEAVKAFENFAAATA